MNESIPIFVGVFVAAAKTWQNSFSIVDESADLVGFHKVSTTNSTTSFSGPTPVFVPSSVAESDGTASAVCAYELASNVCCGEATNGRNLVESDRPIELDNAAFQDRRRRRRRSVFALPETSSIWGTEFARLTMQGAIELADQIIQAGKPEYFITANLNYLMVCEESQPMRAINRNAAAVIADGNPVVIRSRYGVNPLPERVAGSDMIVELGKLSATHGYRIFFLGAAPGVAAKAAEKLSELCPGVHIAGCMSPPFRSLSAEEHEELLAQIRAARPQILLVAFGQPKGELWIDNNCEKLGVPLSIQLGASFDFLAGTAQRAPAFWQFIGFEWLYRAVKEPRRLGPRYAKNIWFLCRMLAKDLLSLLK